MAESDAKTWWGQKSGSAKVFTVLAFGMMLGVGLCGTGAVVSRQSERFSEGCLIAGSVFFWGGLVVLIVFSLVMFFVNLWRRKGGGGT